MGENTGRGSDNLPWLVKQTMCVLNCKAGGPYPLAVMPTPHVPLFVLITNHYSRWRGSVLGRNEVPPGRLSDS